MRPTAPFQRLLTFAYTILLLPIAGHAAATIRWQKKSPITTVAGASCIVTSPGGDTLIIGAYDKGVFVTTDGGDTWRNTLSFAVDSPVYCIAVYNDGLTIAGGEGVIYCSNDYGISWRSVNAPCRYPIRSVIKSGNLLFACSGDYSFGVEYGDGVLISDDNGNNWRSANAGLPATQSVWALAADRTGRIYAACSDINGAGHGGLYYSDNNGALWNHMDLTIDGRGIIYDEVQLTEITNLVISPDDSIICSGNGISGSVAVTGMFRNTFSEAIAGQKWLNAGFWRSVSFWLRSPAMSLSFLNSVEVLGSYTGGLVTGGPYYSADKGNTWQHIIDGIDPVGGGYNANAFCGVNGKRLYMIQHGDNDLYYSDSITYKLETPLPDKHSIAAHLYPNPSKNKLTICADGIGKSLSDITITDIYGRKYANWKATQGYGNLVITHQLPAGHYVINYFSDNSAMHNIGFIVEP